MRAPRVRLFFLLAAVTPAAQLLLGTSRAAEVPWPPSALERLLPANTLAFLSTPDLPRLTGQWNRAGLRKPFANPALQALVDRIEEQLPADWGAAGFDWVRLLSIARGEACLAAVPGKSGLPSVFLGLDVRGCEDQARHLLGSQAHDLQAAKRPATARAGAKPRAGPHVSYFLKDSLLVVTADVETGAAMLGSWPGKPELLLSETWRAVSAKCRPRGDEGPPAIRFYVRPIELAAARMTLPRTGPRMTARQFLAQAEKTGFDAFRAVGGGVWLGSAGRALLYRVAVYAPAARGGNALAMLKMPNRDGLEPPAWVPAAVGGFVGLSWEMKQAFEPFAKVFNTAWAPDDGVFDDVLVSLRDDPHGPRLDVRREIIDQTGNRVLVICDDQRPDTTIWDRTVAAFEIKDQAAVARALKKYFAEDAKEAALGASLQTYAGQAYWRIAEKEEDLIQLPIQWLGAGGAKPGKDAKNAGAQKVRTVFIGAVHGHVLWGKNEALFKRLLAGGKPLAQDPEYARVRRELDRLGLGPASFRSFDRRGDDFRLLARAMDPHHFYSSFFLEAPIAVARTPGGALKIGESSPPALALGPGGWLAQTQGDGWLIVGLALPAPGKEEAKRQRAPSMRTAHTGDVSARLEAPD